MACIENEIIIDIRDVTFRYKQAEKDSLSHVTLTVKRGECVLLCGESGSGKTTVTRLINGLIPHYYEGTLTGNTYVSGRNVTEAELYETAKTVGSVFQNPRSQFFCVDTTSELAFGCENMGLAEEIILSRIVRTAKEMRIEDLLGKSIFGLSGGEKQKIACGCVSAAEPEVFVLDEPTSNLDLRAIEDLRQTLKQWKAAGRTIVVAEHRLWWLVDICDRVVFMKDGTVCADLSMEAFTHLTDEELAEKGLRGIREESSMPEEDPAFASETVECLVLRDFYYAYDRERVLSVDELVLPKHGVIAVTGENGAGKTTFARCLCGLQKGFRGSVTLDGTVRRGKDLLKQSYMVMQDVNHQLFCETVEEEVRLGMKEENEPLVSKVLHMLDLTELTAHHPMGLSGGEKQRVAIASAFLAGKDILVFDEPTSGLDYRNMLRTAELLTSLKDTHTVFVITHDPALIRRCCTHVVRMEKGSVHLSSGVYLQGF
ncbi:MAG: ATP-binding cassette domain-containing protein [Lachnospiraceae bacterium]|nr:ATP-binding cassette domain-containing protein [Lachnospiraceae bacterium]